MASKREGERRTRAKGQRTGINNWISLFVGGLVKLPIERPPGAHSCRMATEVAAANVVAVATCKAMEKCCVSSEITLGNKGIGIIFPRFKRDVKM